MKKSRIVFVIHALNIGGAERIMVTLLNHISRDKYDIHLVIFRATGAFLTDLPSDIVLHDLGVSSAKKGIFPLIQKLYQLKPDIVFSGIGYLNALLSLFIPWINRFMPKPIHWIARETSIVSIIIKKERFTTLFEWLYRHTYHNFDTIVCQSNYMKQDLFDTYGIPKTKMVVIHNPVDSERIKRLSMLPLSSSFDPNKINLIAVGALREVKRFDQLLEAFATLDDRYVLTIVGGGVKEASLKAYARELKIEQAVSFVGHQSNPYAYMHKADLLILTSEYEGFPNVLLEANSCGLPVLAFACPGGVSEIIEEGINGHLIPCQDIPALVEAIFAFEKGIYSPSLLQTHITQHYGIDKIIDQYEAILQ